MKQGEITEIYAKNGYAFIVTDDGFEYFFDKKDRNGKIRNWKCFYAGMKVAFQQSAEYTNGAVNVTPISYDYY